MTRVDAPTFGAWSAMATGFCRTGRSSFSRAMSLVERSSPRPWYPGWTTFWTILATVPPECRAALPIRTVPVGWVAPTSWAQCAAVTTHWGAIRAPPQTPSREAGPSSSVIGIEAMNGYASVESFPWTIARAPVVDATRHRTAAAPTAVALAGRRRTVRERAVGRCGPGGGVETLMRLSFPAAPG